MPPRDAGVEWETASPQSTTVAPSVVAVPAERIKTGAGLGWWRSLLGVGAVVVGVRYLVWQASIAPATVLGVLFVAAETMSVSVLAVTVLTLLDRGSRQRATAADRLARRLRHRVRRAARASSRWPCAAHSPSTTRIGRTSSTTAGSPASAGWEAIDELAARLGAEPITRTTGARSKAAQPEPRAAADLWRLRRHDRRRPPSRSGPRAIGCCAGSPTSRSPSSRQPNGSTSTSTCSTTGSRSSTTCLQPAKDAARLRDLVRERRDLPPRRTRRRQRFQRVEHRRGPAHVVPAARGRMDQRLRARAGHDGPGAEHGSRVRPPARARWMVDGLRLLLLDSPLRKRGLLAARRACTTCTRPARTSSASHCSCSSPLPPLYLVLRMPAAGGSSKPRRLPVTRGALLRPAGRLLRIPRRHRRGPPRVSQRHLRRRDHRRSCSSGPSGDPGEVASRRRRGSAA